MPDEKLFLQNLAHLLLKGDLARGEKISTQLESGEEIVEPPASTPPPPKEKLEDCLAALEQLAGLENVKSEIQSLVGFLEVNKARQENR